MLAGRACSYAFFGHFEVLERSFGEIVISLKSALNIHFSSGEKRILKLVEGILGIVISD